jgi:hypothetical protein
LSSYRGEETARCVPPASRRRAIWRKYELLRDRGGLFNQHEVASSSNRRKGQVMRVDDLDHKELLELDPEGGVIRFAGQRALLLDAVAMGLLRKYLVETLGSPPRGRC